ncbi:hypothetical protein LOTGIDRAFT_237861 [Lottia gigantea]|uniref:Uncharacterized protein n=1 Tax=Lottia gigantea TaxID=225164 RepID=V4AF01_LOTGI|nr:hypothetical protein LOTGIDRAFT_237861 [Lottia gigantea]ESP02614.1 hypothetical protein LOTGIDRAFT_237861 [Lottia gigantea]
MDEDALEVKDDSRPFYSRKNCRIGLYIDIYDAKPIDPTEFGSEQFFLMSLKDKVGEYFEEFDLVKAKGILEKKNVFKGVILEKFDMGLVLTLAFDNVDALDAVWKLFQPNKLSALVNEMFLDQNALKALGLKTLTLQARLWEDEYNYCRNEILSAGPARVSIKKTANGISMLRRLRESQKILQNHVMKCRDQETVFDRNLGEFIMEVKGMLPENVTSINNLKEFVTNLKMAKGTNRKGFPYIEQYLITIEMIREAFAELEFIILHPLAQIHAACETDNQRLLKKSVFETHTDMTKRLKSDQDLQKIVHKEWENKVLFRERKLLLGLVSLIPLSLEKILDIDHMVDEYITSYPEKLKI